MFPNERREPSADLLDLIAKSTAFCFDVDSTVCVDEGIDELAAYLGKGEEVAAMTAAAMGGNVSFRDALENRLRVMQPTRDSVEAFVKNNPPKLSPGIKDLFDALRRDGKTVYLVSGGFRHMINPVADALDVPRSNVFANDLRFSDTDGSYESFNPEEFTSKAGGKAEAVKHIKKTDGHSVMGMVGDGATDLESRAPGGADVFVGYGGVQVRDAVANGADWFVTDFQDIIDVLGK
jgi:phosphoserine phosphatase